MQLLVILYLLILHDATKNKLDYYRGYDCMKKFCKRACSKNNQL